MVEMPKGAPKLEEILVQTDKLPWREKSLKGISEKMLWRDEATGASIAMIKFAKGSGIPQPHFHASNQFMICLSGKYEYTATGVTLTDAAGRGQARRGDGLRGSLVRRAVDDARDRGDGARQCRILVRLGAMG